MSKKYLSREAVIGAVDLKRTDVHCPEWATDGAEWVCAQELSAYDRSVYNNSIIVVSEDGKDSKLNLTGATVLFAALSIVDPETGAKLFTAEELGKKDPKVIDRIVTAAKGLGSAIAAADVEAIADGFLETPSPDSPSVSPEN